MKKFLALSVFAFALSAVPAYASTIDLSPQTVTVAPGDTVTVTVSIDPAGASISAVKAVLAYPTGLLTPTSFTFAPTWIPVTQSGYDQMGGGSIIKSAGYPGGLTSATALGTMTFTAQAEGVATVSVDNSSLTYDASNHNALAGAQGTSVITIQVATATSSTPVGSTTTPPTTGNVAPPHTSSSPTNAAITTTSLDAASSIATSTAVGQTQDNVPPQVAAVAGAGGLALLNSWWVWLALALLILIGVGISWWYARKQQAPRTTVS